MEADHRGCADSGTFLFTVALLEDHYGALIEHVDTLRLAFRACRDRYPFTMSAGVVLPDHLHCILTLPPADAARSARWRLIKGLFERVCGGGREMWTSGHDERLLAGDVELSREADRIHADPVHHGLVRLAKDWPYSSFHAYVASGLRPSYWREQPEDASVPRLARRAA